MPRSKDPDAGGRPRILNEKVPRGPDPTDPKKTLPEQTRGEMVLLALRNGARTVTAFAYGGVRYQTGMEILRRGRRAIEQRKHTWQREFLQAYESARMEARLRMEQVLFEAAHKNRSPRWALEWLKRNYPDDWGDRLALEDTRQYVRRLGEALHAPEEEVRDVLAQVEEHVNSLD